MSTIVSGHVAQERLLHYAVWGAQLLLSLFFAAMGVLKLVTEAERLVEIMAWTASVPLPLVRALGLCELLGAIVVAAPVVTRTPQRIVGYTALFFLTLMTSAAIVHISRGELRMLAVNVTVAAVAAFVVWGRLAHQPLEEADQH